MIEGSRWIVALIALAGSLVFGEIGSRLLRAALGRADRSPEIREIARPVASVVFWMSTALGVLVAVASTSRHAFEEIPDRMLARLPDLLIAGVVVVVGYALAVGLGAAVVQASVRASGRRQPRLERTVRWSVAGISAAVAASQLGVDTTVLGLIFAVLVGAPAFAVALLTALGGRAVATDIAAGRALRGQLKVGYRLASGSIDGLIVAVHPVSVEVEEEDGTRTHLPLHCLLDAPYSVAPARTRA